MVTKIKTKLYGKNLIYLPQLLWRDSTFPFEEKDSIEIEIVDGKIVISKTEETIR